MGGANSTTWMISAFQCLHSGLVIVARILLSWLFTKVRVDSMLCGKSIQSIYSVNGVIVLFFYPNLRGRSTVYWHLELWSSRAAFMVGGQFKNANVRVLTTVVRKSCLCNL